MLCKHVFSHENMLNGEKKKMYICCFFFSEQSKANEEKFKKMKDVYHKLRDEHVTLLRQVEI